MIFVTVGTDLPFDRLVQAVDRWAAATGRSDVYAQIGHGGWKPQHLGYNHFLEPPEFSRRFRDAALIISHAGMGTILNALRYGKPILVMPRRASLGEQRNEHQLATATHLLRMGKISVAFDEKELHERLLHLEGLQSSQQISAFAGPALIDSIKDFILSTPGPNERKD